MGFSLRIQKLFEQMIILFCPVNCMDLAVLWEFRSVSSSATSKPSGYTQFGQQTFIHEARQ